MYLKTYLITAPVKLNIGPSKILKGPVNIRIEHQIGSTTPKDPNIIFIIKLRKPAMAPEAESRKSM